MTIPLVITDAFVVICLLPLFIIRAIHWTFDRIVWNDKEASKLVDSFELKYSKYLKRLEIRPNRFISCLEIRCEVAAESKGMVVFIHGACARMQQFCHQIEFFTKSGYDVLSYDALGCGSSDKPVGLSYYRSEEMFLDFCRFIDLYAGTQTNRVTLVGHSMGGAMVLKYISSHKVRSAVAISPALFSEKRQLPTNIFKLPVSLLWIVRPLLGLRVREMLFGPTASLMLIRQEREASARNPVHMFRAFYLGINREFFALSSMATSLGTPTLLLAAELDKVCVAVEEYQGRWPSTRLEKLPNVGHQCMQENPDLINRLLIEHVK